MLPARQQRGVEVCVLNFVRMCGSCHAGVGGVLHIFGQCTSSVDPVRQRIGFQGQLRSDQINSGMSWSSLPEELWKLIMAHVPLPERLGTCSRVSKKLCRAAAAATEQLKLWGDTQRSEAIKHWLQHQGQHVTNLEVSRLTGDLTQLPCPHLRRLCVCNNIRVQLGPSSSQLGILHSCSGLTTLLIQHCTAADAPDSLSALSSIPALQHLEITGFRSAVATHQLSLPGSVLQVLTQLTLLSVGVEITIESLQHISALQHLMVLRLDSLSVPLSPSSTPSLAQLTGLHTLILSDATLDPTLLQHRTHLQVLRLAICTFAGANSAAVLLSVIGQLLQLQELKLSTPDREWPTAAAAFTALTASSRLQKLSLLLDGLPAGIWQAVFSRQQQLQSLIACRWQGEEDDVLQDPAASDFSSADLARLADCCPGLQDLAKDLQLDVQLTALSQLTALTVLTVFMANQASVKSLSVLSGLKELTAYVQPPFSARALLPLTALQQLRILNVCAEEGAQLADDDSDDSQDLCMRNQAGDSAPDVWLQLLEHSASISSCQPALIRGLSLQLVEQQQLVSTLEAQCRQQQQQMMQQQQQQINQLRQHADAAGQRMAALEGKVAQLIEALQHRG